MKDYLKEDNYNRIISLDELCGYPGVDYLDMDFQFPPCDKPLRVWLKTAACSPEIRVDDALFSPVDMFAGASARWLDYGVVRMPPMPAAFAQLKVFGMNVVEARDSFLAISEDVDLSFAGRTLSEAEKLLWGLSREEAGKTILSPQRLPVGSPADFRVSYTVGSGGLPAGALIRFCIPAAFAFPQNDRPGGNGFSYVECSDDSLEIISMASSRETGYRSEILCKLKKSFDAGESFTLYYSTDSTYIFPHLFDDAEQKYGYTKVPVLFAETSLSGNHPFLAPQKKNSHVMEFFTGPAERLHLFLPGRRFHDEKLKLAGLFTDHYRNPASEGKDTDFTLYLKNSDGLIFDIEQPQGHFTSLFRFEISLPELPEGVYRAFALKKDGSESARSNPMEIVKDKNSDRIFWGEIHSHTEMSDGLGGFHDAYVHARDNAAMDFASVSDHACYFSDNEWEYMQDITNSFDDPGSFTTLVGYEWAGKQKHRNFYTSQNRLELFRGMYHPTRSIDKVWEYFKGNEDVVAGPHGLLAHGISWEYHEAEVERFVEIYSMWGACDSRNNSLVSEAALKNPEGIPVNELLGKGAVLGFTGGGDCHEAHPGFSSEDPDGQGKTKHTFSKNILYRCGMTAVVMPVLDRKNLISALRNRRTYATTGARILLNFNIGDLKMGDVGSVEDVKCKFKINACSSIKCIEIIKNGKVVWEKKAENGQVDMDEVWEDADGNSASESYYYLHVIQDDGQQAWSSPIWTKYVKNGG